MATGIGFLDGYLPYVLRQADQTLSAPFYAVLGNHGIARSEWRVLAVLEAHGELCVADVATAALSPQPTVTHALRRLEERGLVTRVHGTDDRRQRFVSLTDSGAALTAALIEDARRLESDALAGAGDLSALLGELRELTDRVAERVPTIPGTMS